MSESTLHVTVIDADEKEMREVRNQIKDELGSLPGVGNVVVTNERLEISEVPAMDDYLDILAERVAHELEARR